MSISGAGALLERVRRRVVTVTLCTASIFLAGTAIAHAESEFLLKAENLKDLTSPIAALENLGLIHPKGDTTLGQEAFVSNTIGQSDTAIGAKAMKSNTTGSEDTVIGNEAASTETGASKDIAIGNAAMRNAETGSDGNVAVGNVALYDATTATDDVAIGNDAMSSYFKEPTTGERDTAVGHEAAAGLTSGIRDTDVGFNADDEDRTGSGNTAIGTLTLGAAAEHQPDNHSEDTAVGTFAGEHDESGNGNVFLGYEAGAQIKSESDVLYIADTPTTSPLIFGNFSSHVVKINGKLEVTETAQAPVKPTEGEANSGATAVVDRKTSFAITGNGTKTKWTLKHGLATRLVSVTVQKSESESPGELEQSTVYKVKPISGAEVEITFNTAPAAGEEKFVTVSG